ncbi:MAG TPA: tetratricopeptide repeat protein, partial [Actinomycetota bacterium]|nr:tetratricopeptide repeat protein [Actinomycetota bacterium]
SEGQRWMEQALTRAADVSPACRAKCLEGAGVLARSQGEYKRAAALIEECIALRREGGDLDGLASALKNLGIVAADRGDIDAARVLYEESLDLRKQTGDGRGIAEAQNNLGVVAGVKGDWVTAASYYEEALAYFRDRGDRHGMGRVLLNLGEARFEQGDFEAAGELAKESIRLCREIGSRWDLCDLLEEMGSIVNGKGRAEDGARLYGAAEALRELLGAPLPTSEVDLYNRRLDQIRDALDARAFEAAWAEGLDMDVDDAVDLALRS